MKGPIQIFIIKAAGECPSCGAEITHSGNNCGRRRPRPGDVALCVGCGALMTYETGKALRLATAAEKKRLQRKEPAFWAEVEHFSRRIIEEHLTGRARP